MKKISIGTLGVSIVALALLNSCSSHELASQAFPQGSRILDSKEMSDKIMVVNISEAIDALFDSAPEGLQKRAALQLKVKDLLDDDDKKLPASEQPAQVCTDEDDKVIIANKKQESSTNSFESPTETRSVEANLQSTITRTYTHAEERIECARNLPIVEIDADEDAIGLQLNILVERQESTKTTSVFKGTPPIVPQTPPGPAPNPPAAPALAQQADPIDKNLLPTAPVQTGATAPTVVTEVAISKGERQVLWQDVVEEGDLTIHKKTIKGTTTRTQTIGTTSLLLTVQLAFEVTDTYSNPDDLAIGQGSIMKTIESGTVTSIRQKDGKALTTFEKLTIDLRNDSCRLTGGRIISSIYAEGAAQPKQTIEFDASTGSIKVKIDGTTTQAAPFDPTKEVCDREELRN